MAPSAKQSGYGAVPRFHARRFEKLQVIVKAAERCNLACPYCYYFFGGDDSYRQRPSLIRPEIVQGLATFLAQGCTDLEIPLVQIVFHGGEPMLVNPRKLETYCAQLHDVLSKVTKVQFSIQTNGTLFTEEWIRILSEFQFSVGISIDGSKEIHDKFRYDHRGTGSYDAIVRGLQLIERLREKYDLQQPGVICVLNADYDYSEIIRHLYEDLGFRRISLLLPDCNNDTGVAFGHSAAAYGSILCAIYDQWKEYPDLSIREIDYILRRFQLTKYTEEAIAKKRRMDSAGERMYANQIIVVQSDGTISVDDTFIPTASWRKSAPVGSVFDSSLERFLNGPFYDELDRLYADSPAACRDCCWQSICNGGHIENRYSENCGFDQPSVFCDGLKIFYSHVVRDLYEAGYPLDILEELLTKPIGERIHDFAH